MAKGGRGGGGRRAAEVGTVRDTRQRICMKPRQSEKDCIHLRAHVWPPACVPVFNPSGPSRARSLSSSLYSSKDG